MMQDKRKLTIVVLAVSNMFTQCCRALINPYFPPVAAEKGVSESVVGLIFSSAEFTIFLTSPIFGTLLSHVNTKFIYITGLCVYGCCEIMFAFLDRSPPGTQFIAICLAVRIVEATGTTALMTASFAIAGNTYPEKIATVYSIIQTAVGAGYLIGPAIGGVLYDSGGYGVPFWTLGSCVLLCAGLSMLLLPTQQDVKHKKTSTIFTLLRSPLVCFAVLSVLCNMMSISAYNPTLTQELARFGVGPAGAGYIFLIPPAAYSLTNPFWGVLLDRKGGPLVMALSGLIVSVFVLFLFGPAPFLTFIPNTLWLKIVSATLLGLTVAMTAVGGVNCIVRGARLLGFKDDGATFGLVGALSQTSSCCGGFVGPLIGGAVTEYYGFGWSMVVVTFVYILPVGVGLVLASCKRPKKKGIGIRRPCLQKHHYSTLPDDDDLVGTKL